MNFEKLYSREITIHPSRTTSLQEQLRLAQKEGISRIILEGDFEPSHPNQFCMIAVSKSLELVGINGATINGKGRTTHLIYVENGATFKASGLALTGGNTKDIKSQASQENHPGKRLNIFQYLDGGAISMGVGSVVELKNCLLDSNYSAICGGAISNLGGYLKIDNCTFAANSCGDTGAAIDNLSSGSLSVINNSIFVDNQANRLGRGYYGAITAFPNTFLIVSGCDFSQESRPAIDYWDQGAKLSRCFIRGCVFSASNPEPVVKNPLSNHGVRKEILKRYLRLLVSQPHLVKFEGVPKVGEDIRARHEAIFNDLSYIYNYENLLDQTVKTSNF